MTEESWSIKRWSELTTEDLHAILNLRIRVFVVEQECPYPELDGKDKDAMHLWSEDELGVRSYLRILPPGLSYQESSIGRVVARKDLRKNGLGRLLMQKGVELCEHHYGSSIRISAQAYLREFYEGLGFVRVSNNTYLEDGIPHYEMIKK